MFPAIWVAPARGRGPGGSARRRCGARAGRGLPRRAWPCLPALWRCWRADPQSRRADECAAPAPRAAACALCGRSWVFASAAREPSRVRATSESREDALPYALRTRTSSPPQQVRGGRRRRGYDLRLEEQKVSGTFCARELGVGLARNAAAADFWEAQALPASLPASQQADSSRWRSHFSGGNLAGNGRRRRGARTTLICKSGAGSV